ncbi:MAG: hypothetical protein L0H94_01215 [Nitrospira sp.]|nr:hypothetical protein [Nitrospira sp.]
MTCHRCHGFMWPVDLLIGECGSKEDAVRGWRCVACGEIIDRVIARNRLRARGRRLSKRQKKPRLPVLKIPAF